MRARCRTAAAPAFLCAVLWALLLPLIAQAQYFGKNTVRYDTFDFAVLRTEHFDIYYYEDTAAHIELIAQMAERWNERLSAVLDHQLTRRQPIIMYANHPHFRQTNTVPADIGEGTGGFTEIFRNRVVLPFAGTLAETEHVLGHELVHAYQFDMTGRAADPDRFGNIPGAIRLPLWLVEGMAEYLSVGPYDSMSAMWLRDLVARDETIEPGRMMPPFFQPYRHGHGLLAYIGGRYGDRAVGRLLVEAAAGRDRGQQAFPAALGIELDALLEDWQRDLRAHFGPMIEHAQRPEQLGRELLPARDDRGLPNMNLGPALSPDGTRLVYLSQPDRLQLDMFLMDVKTGENIRRLTRTALDPHFEALQFVRSAGSWSPDGEQFVFAGIRRGQPVLQIIDGRSGRNVATHPFRNLGEIFNPAWSPDGRRIVFAAMRDGLSDLYVYDVAADELEQLTSDMHSVLQPVWSPDGTTIAFATDRFPAHPDELMGERHALALLHLESGDIEALPAVAGARQVNPNWSADGESIYFLSDPRGTSNVYRLDLRSGGIVELTNVQTGISGLTAQSPALSVAGPHDSLAFTLFGAGGFAMMLIEEGAAIEGTPLDEISYGRHLALLPPLQREEQYVAEFLLDRTPALPPDPVLEVRPYQARVRPEFISQAMIGGGAGSFGTFVGGGVSVHWSDMLGNHNVVTQLHAEVAENEDVVNSVAAVVGYENRERRFDWGAVAAQVPLRSAAFGQAVVDVDGERVLLQRAVRFWEINRTVSGRIAYPFSRATRVEFDAGYRHISFDAEEQVRGFSTATGEQLLNERDGLPTPSSLHLGTASAAWVYDTSVFGGTAPVVGQRSRLEVGGVTGDLTFFTPLADYRRYWTPREAWPLSFGARVMHFGRYGADAEDARLRPLFLGSPNLVRGYGTGFRAIADPVLERLQGSRIAVANAELRLPLTGVRGIIGGAFWVPLDAALFYDAGTAWSSGDRPEFLGGDARGITSYGASLRVNLGGFVLSLDYVNPPQFEDQGWHWQLSFVPGF
jgi:Tol biopolymer transport system component